MEVKARPGTINMQTFKDIQSPFAALRTQLDGITPGQSPLDCTIGAPKHPAPDWVKDKLNEAIGSLGAYPAIRGSNELRAAIINWAENRFETLQGQLTDDHCLPLNGSREGLFYACFSAKARRSDINKPVVLLPNPYYQVYSAAAIAAGAEPVFLNATEQTNFLPNLTSIDPEVLARTIALYLCTPSNPEGAVANQAYLQTAIKLARQHNFMLFSDECYSEIYTQEKPGSALEAALALSNDMTNVCAFNSLSKRSNVPGLRSGIILGDPAFMKDFANFRNVAAPQIPGPIQHASTHLWSDETHVIENRKQYQAKFELAEKVLKPHFSFKKPQGGFFLWLNFSKFGGGIDAVTTLWKGCGVKLLPGAYLARSDHHGINPGVQYARMALVANLDQTQEALERIKSCMG